MFTMLEAFESSHKPVSQEAPFKDTIRGLNKIDLVGPEDGSFSTHVWHFDHGYLIHTLERDGALAEVQSYLFGRTSSHLDDLLEIKMTGDCPPTHTLQLWSFDPVLSCFMKRVTSVGHILAASVDCTISFPDLINRGANTEHRFIGLRGVQI